MKKFEFRLEPLLKYRKLQEDQAQVQLTAASQTLRQAQDELSRYQNELEEQLRQFREMQLQAASVETFKIFRDYADIIQGRIVFQRQRVREAEAVRDTCLAAMHEALKQRKLVEMLKQKRWLQYQAEARSEEQKVLDEMGLKHRFDHNGV